MAELVFISIGIYSGAGTMDPAAMHAPWSFRAIIFPGVVALWPIVLRKSLSIPPTPRH